MMRFQRPAATASTCCRKTARTLSRHFAGRPAADAVPACDIVQGLPRLSGCVAFFACELIRTVDVSDHTLFIAEVSTCDYSDTLPLVFFSSRYHLGPGIRRIDEGAAWRGAGLTLPSRGG